MPSTLSTTTKKIVVTAVLSSLTSALVTYWWHRKVLRGESSLWSSRRKEERTGRIRAEVKLRTTLKEVQRLRVLLKSSSESSSSSTGRTPPDENEAGLMMVMSAIGTVVSPYTKRMGTPRQPQLVPASRGYIDLNQVPAASLSGIEEYSHIWVLFEFHANTDLGSGGKKNGKSKIRPPRGGGIKVGQLATRSPHRPNPIGLSLVRVEQWDPVNRRLHISGLDLVHGTPVYDIKPYVPWDLPGYSPNDQQTNVLLFNTTTNNQKGMKVPSWVVQQDTIATVTFSDTATQQLQELLLEGRFAPLYTQDNDGFAGAMQTLQQVLAQDPRSSHKGIKENARGTTATTTNTAAVDDNKSNGQSSSSKGYRLIFGQCQVEFVVLSGEQGVLVTELSPVNFDASSYVDGIPLISESSLGN